MGRIVEADFDKNPKQWELEVKNIVLTNFLTELAEENKNQKETILQLEKIIANFHKQNIKNELKIKKLEKKIKEVEGNVSDE